MTILNKLNIKTHLYIIAITTVSLIACMSIEQHNSSNFLDKILSEINYFTAKDKNNLEKQNIVNEKDNFYKQHVKIIYTNSKKIEIYYHDKYSLSYFYRFPEKILYGINDASKIKNITFDGQVITIDSSFLDDIKNNNLWQTKSLLKRNSENHLIIELK